MKNNDFEKLCIKIIVDYFNEKVDKSDNFRLKEKNVQQAIFICE